MVVKYPLKGVFKTTAKGKVYWYAWRGPPLGPRLRGEPGSPEFHASYVEAHQALRAPDAARFHSLVVLYKTSHAYAKLAPYTKKKWAPWLDRVAEDFGELRIAQFDRAQKIRQIIRQWRGQWADKPRTADYGLGVLSRVLAHGVELGKIAGNPCEGIKGLYSGGNRSEIIWSEADIAALKARCSPEIGHAADLAAHTGLRLGDLVRLAWSHVGDNAITIATSKSRHRIKATIPLYDALRDVLASIPKRSPTILTNSMGRPWTANGLGSAFSVAKNEAGLTALHFHDLRGTAATRFYTAGIEPSDIAVIMGWEGEHVEKIVRHYVDRSAVIIAKLNEKRT